MRYYGKSDIGMCRSENQDSYKITSAPDKMILAVVCDGMGGAAGGRTASKTAAEEFCRVADSILQEKFKSKEELSDEDFRWILQTAVYYANLKVFNLAGTKEELAGMGTTLTGALVRDDWYWIVNVGDSRAYRFHRDKIKLLTHDHSYVQMLVDLGRITLTEAQFHPQKNIITRAIGVGSSVETDVFSGPLGEDDLILLASDGLTNMLMDSEILKLVMNKQPLRNTVKDLITDANNKGGDDNITAVLIQTKGNNS